MDVQDALRGTTVLFLFGCYPVAQPAKGILMRALLIAVAIGAILAAGAGLGAGAVLSGVANGKPVNAQLYNYGQR
jgi:hypothetical protein